MSRLTSLVAVAAVALAGCGGAEGSETVLEQGPAVEGFRFTEASTVAEGEPIHVRFTCDGADISPALAWDGAPEGAKELALVLEDPDALGGAFTHWLVYGLGPTVTGLPPGDKDWTGYGPGTPREGENDFGDAGYGGPCPPGGDEHRYVFRLLALHAPVDL